MRYLARFARDPDGGYIITFPDIPEAMTNGADRAAGLANATEALELAVLEYYRRRAPLPNPSRRSAEGGSYSWVQVPVHALAKMAFVDAFDASGLTRTALAQRLGKGENEVRRMLNPLHATKIDALEAGLRELGKRVVFAIEDAA